MYPVIDPKSFEGQGDGFGISSPQELAELNKALEAGVATTPGAQTGGGALRVESLDATLKIVSYLMKNIVLYNDIPKSKAYNTVEEYNLLSKYGGKGGFFISEGGLPRTEDSTYTRKVQFVKFMGTTREVSHPMLLVKPAHGNVVALETKNGAMWMLRQMEESLFNANSSIITQAFDGLKTQAIAGYADSTTGGDLQPATSNEHVIDMRGAPLTEGIFAEASRILLDNHYFPTACYLPHSAHRDYNVGFFSKGRYPIGGADANETGFDSRIVKTSGGKIVLKPNVFLRIDKTAPTTAENSSVPTKPALAAVTVGAVSTSRGFLAAEYASYTYSVTAISRNGESDAAVGNATAVVAAAGSAEVTVTITRGAVSGNDLATGYRIYRTRYEDGIAGTKYLIAEIASSGASTVFKDGNESLPGLGEAYVGQYDETVLTLRELSPMLKFPLATVASSIRWMQLYYNTPILFRPRGIICIKNIGRLSVPSLGAD